MKMNESNFLHRVVLAVLWIAVGLPVLMLFLIGEIGYGIFCTMIFGSVMLAIHNAVMNPGNTNFARRVNSVIQRVLDALESTVNGIESVVIRVFTIAMIVLAVVVGLVILLFMYEDIKSLFSNPTPALLFFIVIVAVVIAYENGKADGKSSNSHRNYDDY